MLEALGDLETVQLNSIHGFIWAVIDTSVLAFCCIVGTCSKCYHTWIDLGPDIVALCVYSLESDLSGANNGMTFSSARLGTGQRVNCAATKRM